MIEQYSKVLPCMPLNACYQRHA